MGQGGGGAGVGDKALTPRGFLEKAARQQLQGNRATDFRVAGTENFAKSSLAEKLEKAVVRDRRVRREIGHGLLRAIIAGHRNGGRVANSSACRRPRRPQLDAARQAARRVGKEIHDGLRDVLGSQFPVRTLVPAPTGESRGHRSRHDVQTRGCCRVGPPASMLR